MNIGTVLEELATLDTASVADILGGRGTMHSTIKPVKKVMHLSGRAYTASTPPGDMLTCYAALESCPPGMVLVIDGGSYTESAIWGSLMTYQAQAKGLTGIIIDGAVRDVTRIRELNIPVFAITASPRDGTIRALGELDRNVTCGGACVRPGDYLIGDDDGVVSIPQEHIAHVVEKAKDTKMLERSVMAEIDAGRSLYGLLGLQDIVDKKQKKDVAIVSDLFGELGLK
jgi:regulator of RNase E activity RraA